MAVSTKATVPVTCLKSGAACAREAKRVVAHLHLPDGFDVMGRFTERFKKCYGPVKALQQAAANILDHSIAVANYRAAGMREQLRLSKVNLEHAVGVYDETLARLAKLRARRKYPRRRKTKAA